MRALARRLAPFVVTTLLSASAAADALDDKSLLVGIERVTGVAFGHVEASANGQSATTTSTDVTMLWNQGGAPVYGTPRFAFDGIVARQFTLGGAIGYAAHSASVDRGTGDSTDQPSLSTFAVAPRVGFLYAASSSVYLWPRVGMTYFRQSEDTAASPGSSKTTIVTHGESIDIDPAIAYFPVDHFGFLFEANVSIPLGGGESETSPSGSINTADVAVKDRSIGFFVGLLGAL